MNEEQSRASTWCEYYRPDSTCVLMQALQSETDPRCKVFRDPPADCVIYDWLLQNKNKGALCMKTMHINHKQWIEDGKRYEVTEIYAPGPQAKPLHSFDRNMPVDSMSDLQAALQSLKFGELASASFADKYGAEGASYTSSVPGAALIFGSED
ncbi:hypothetical protein D3C77_429120 [compost metagenome]